MFINNQTQRMGYLALGQSKTGKLPDTPQSESGVKPNGTQPENTYSKDTPYTKEISEVYKQRALPHINITGNNGYEKEGENTTKTPGKNCYEKEGENTTKTPEKNCYEKEGENTTKTTGNNNYVIGEETNNTPGNNNLIWAERFGTPLKEVYVKGEETNNTPGNNNLIWAERFGTPVGVYEVKEEEIHEPPVYEKEELRSEPR